MILLIPRWVWRCVAVTRRQAAFAGGLVGLIVPAIVLTLLYLFGIWRIVRVGSTDLTHILWPFSVMLTTTWHSTIGGVLITVAAVAFNCLMYIALALLLQAFMRLINHRGAA
jgi:hypothetical protein